MARSVETIRKRKARKVARIRARKVKGAHKQVEIDLQGHGYHTAVQRLRATTGCDYNEGRIIVSRIKHDIEQRNEQTKRADD